MDNLPPPLIIEILSRLTDSSALARCRLSCNTLNSLSYEITSINLICSFDRYTKSRSSPSPSLITPFKSIVDNLIPKLSCLESISIGVDNVMQELSYDDCDDDSDDFYLTDVDFVSCWLPAVAEGLKSLSFCDFWVQSCWRRSRVLSFISWNCQRLHELEVKNAWLSVEGVSTMSSLTCLTLEFVRIDDENLSTLNDCCPCLEILNLIGVGGLKEPRIYLQHLKRCCWTVSDVPLSLTVFAPKLIKLKLQCVKPRSLLLETPLLSDFYLTLDMAGTISIGELPSLKTLRLKVGYIRDFNSAFPCAKAVNELTLDTLNKTEKAKGGNSNIDILFDVFPNMSSLNLGPGAYSEMEASFGSREFVGRIVMEGLKSLTAYLVIRDINVTVSFISNILNKCHNLSAVSLLTHHELDSTIANNIITRCMALCSRVRWKWGIWREGCKDDWLSVGH